MAYQMTPSERRARALAMKQQRENRNLYQQYLTQKEEYDRRVEQERLNALYEENKVKNQNFFVRVGHTIGDIAANVITGAVKGLEGIYDLGAGIVGAVGGIFDKGFQDDVKKHISYDWTMETFGNDWQEALKYSYTKNGGIVESVASGIGQMLPSVAVTIATGGAGAPAAVSQMASLATLGASAAGNSTEEAYKDGAGYYAGLGYGLASGAVEMATEKMFGGATKGLFGKGMLDDVGKSIADTGIKRIAKNALEEGVEEIVSELANPLLRSMYKGGEALQDYGTGEYWAGVAKAGIVGSLTSLAYTGTVGYGLSKAGVGYVGKEADINDSLAEIETQKKKAENLFANEKLTEQNESRISSNIVGNYQNIERTLKKASESKRASLIKQFSLEKAFNPDGSIKGDFATQIGLASNEAQVAQEGQQGSNEGLASQFKKEYYSPSLRGSEAMIQSDLAAMTERLGTDEKNFAEQQGREAQEIAEVKPFTGEMSETAKKNYTSLKKGLNSLNNTSGGKIRLVVVDPHDSINGSIVNDSTFYISESQLESGAWAETLVHEYTHFAEGSKEYGKLLGFLQSDDILVEGVEGQSIPLWQKAQEAVIRNYGFDQKRLESIVERVGKNETLSPEDTVYYNAYLSELGAHESEYLLGNEAFIDKIVRKDKSLAAKIIDKIRNLKSMFEKTNDTRTRKEQRLINKAEKLWLNSVEKAGLKYSGGKIYRRREVDAEAQNEYNGEVAEVSLSRKDKLLYGTFPTYKEGKGTQANELSTRWAHRADIEVGDRTTMSFNGEWYLIEKFDDSEWGYQIVGKLTEEQYQEYTEDRKNVAEKQSIQKSVSSITSLDRRRDSSNRGVVSDNKVSPRNGGSDNQIQRVGEEQSQRGKTQSNRSGNSEGGGQGKRGIKFSLKESEVSDSALQELNKTRQEAYNAEREAQKRLDSFTEFEERKKRLIDILSDKNSTNEQIKTATDEYAKWESESGYGEAYKAHSEAARKMREVQMQISQMERSLNERLYQHTYTSEEVRDYVSKAVKKFHTTTRLDKASYLLTTGSMLDFSDGQGYRVQDHREISDILNLPDYAEYSTGMILFMNMGNIRLQTYGIDIAAMPTERQISALRGIISEIMRNEDAFCVDFSTNKGNTDGSVEYPKGTSSSRIISDIRKYFETGELPEVPDDSLSRFRFSRKTTGRDTEGKRLTDEQIKFFEDSIGYDGVILNNSLAVVFNPNQIKLTTNESPTRNPDIRFSKKPTPVEEMHRTYYKLSDGQIKKLLANNTHYKVYSKVDAERIINNILSQYMSFGEKYGEINGKTKTEVVDMLWKGLNSAEPGKQMGVALHIADYIIQNSVLESIYADDDVQVQAAIDIIDALRPYLHSINLDSLKGEIKYKCDKDNSAYLLWGKRKGERGIGVDTIPQILEGEGIYIDATSEADIFFEIDAQYRNAVKSLKKRAKDMLSESLSKDQIKELRQEIAREVLRGFDYTGKSSKLAEVLDKYKKQISTLYEKLRDSNRHNKATNRLLDKVQKIKNWKTGAFVNSSKFRSKLFKGSIERLAMIKNRGNLNQSGTRRILAGLAEWYAKDNPILGYVDGDNVGIYNQEIADILQAVAQNQKALTDEQVDLISVLQEKSGITDYKGLLEWYTKANLGKGYSAEVKSLLRELASETTFTTEEIIALEKVVGYFGNLIENYNKVIRNGKYVDAKPIAEGYIETIKRNKGVKVGWFSKFFDKVFNNGKASYLQTFADPMTVARYMDKYENGFYSEMLAELRAGGIKASVLEMNIRQPLEEFLSKHKKYGRGVSQRTIKYKGAELPALDAFLLYMTMNREQALGGLAEAGFTFNNGKETIRVDGFAKGEELTLAELRERAKAEQDELYKQFTEEDREYISIAEKIFNEDCKETKRETDILRQGYSNVFEGYYVPIRRANSAVTVDSGNFFDEMNRVSNASFNKDTVQGAKGELFIEGLDEVLDRHIHGISQYAGLATVIDQYDILYNLNMSEDANKPITVRTESENTWAKGNDYFKKLISDLQGISPTRGGGSKLFGFFRGHYATYQLGLNPKVWFTQLSSFFASGSVLDYSSILKGLSINAKDVDEYCQLAAVRNNDNSAAMAQGVMDKVDKVGSALMKPIGMVDRFVVKKLFGACQVQVEKESGLKVGTEENKKKAGELLEKVIVETQQNSMATERSAAMRSGSELMKTLTMFTADSMKVFGRVVDSLGEVSVLKAKIKETTDSKVKAELEEKLKAAKKKSVKSVAALATMAIFMAIIAQAFRWLYNKDDEDENIPANMAVDAIGNLMGGLPLIKDLYAKLTEGYDLNNYSYSALNDLFGAFSGTISTVTSLAKGEEVKPLRTVKELSFAVGQILGLPTRNVYNIIYGLTKRISPSTAYGWDSNLYNKNYATDLQKAINNDDDEMLATIVGLMLNEKVGGIDNSFAREEMDRLVKGGYQVLPKSIGNTITYEGEEVEITSKQRERFKKIYGEANKALASLVNDKSYASANDEVKAKAVRFIYDIYYNLAIEDLLGVDLETKNILFAKAIDISSLAIIVATARSLEADTDKKGNIISGSRKKKVQTYINSLGLKAAQKYMIMGYLGYSNKYGQQQVKSYIQRLSLTKSEKEKLYEYSGYAA